MKKVLVTGATGFVGANLVRRLVREKYEVHILKRKASDIWRIKDISSELYIYNIDLTEKTLLSKLMNKVRPQFIFHLANLGLYGGIDSTLEESVKVNLFGTFNLIDGLEKVGYECFINTGSSSEYGIKTSPMAEDEICQPETNYALTKLAATLYAKSYAKINNKPIVTLRLFSPFGPFDHSSRFIAQAILKMQKGQTVSVRNPNALRDYIFIDDVIDAFTLCIKNYSKLSGEIINIGRGSQISMKYMVELLAKQIGSKTKIIFGKPIKDKNMWQADIRRAKLKLGWTPKTNLAKGVRTTLEWFKQNSHYYGQ